MKREDCLTLAKACVTGHREQDYGTPESNFGKIASLWRAYTGQAFLASDVAVMLALVKIARLSNNRTHADSWVDLAGYAACGAEVAGAESTSVADTEPKQ